jgi:hypothetical protein
MMIETCPHAGYTLNGNLHYISEEYNCAYRNSINIVGYISGRSSNPECGRSITPPVALTGHSIFLPPCLLREACMADPGNIVEFISSKDIWYELRQDAIVAASKEAFLSGYLKATILNHETMQNALAYNLAHKLGGPGSLPR